MSLFQRRKSFAQLLADAQLDTTPPPTPRPRVDRPGGWTGLTSQSGREGARFYRTDGTWYVYAVMLDERSRPTDDYKVYVEMRRDGDDRRARPRRTLRVEPTYAAVEAAADRLLTRAHVHVPPAKTRKSALR